MAIARLFAKDPGYQSGTYARTLQEVGDAFQPQISRERVRQLEAKALGKLRRECARVGLGPECLDAMVMVWPRVLRPRMVPRGRAKMRRAYRGRLMRAFS